MKTKQLKIEDIEIDVLLKNIKNIHLSVHPPNGRVRISAPSRTSLKTLRLFAISKLAWIKKKQRKMLERPRETPREYLDLESHYVWGKRYTLKIVEIDKPPSIELKHSDMLLQVRPGADTKKKHAVVEAWYRERLREAAVPLIAKWEIEMGVKMEKLFIQRMKTKWGSCNTTARNIRLNTELVKRPRECLEYVVIHELAHLLEPRHDARFYALVGQYMPDWKVYKDMLNQGGLGDGDLGK